MSKKPVTMTFTVDELWDALRKQCCSTTPHTKAKAIIMLRRQDIAMLFKKDKE